MTPERRISRCCEGDPCTRVARRPRLHGRWLRCDEEDRGQRIPDRRSDPEREWTHTITVVGTTTIPNVKAGTRIKCKGWLGHGGKVPRMGSEAIVGGGTAAPNGVPPTSHQIRLNHSENGSLT